MKIIMENKKHLSNINFSILQLKTEITSATKNNGGFTPWGQDVMLRESDKHPGNRNT